ATIFSVMLGNGYGIARLQENAMRTLPLAPDVFNPAQDPHLPVIWIDGWHAGSDMPQVVAVGADGRPISNSVIANAQAPAISANSQYVAFIREREGRGTLWMKHVGTGSVPEGGEQQETAADLDVWESTFTPEGTLVFSAASGGRPALFLVHPGDTPTVRALPLPSPARYPAVSPDGKWLAFSHLEGGVWHLWLADTRTWSTRRLTQSNCNSITPAWDSGSRQLTFASDCGRGLGLTALCRMSLWPAH
ncbi:MAG: TolB family protein, partial [Chlamydiota bacterium]